ncbi:MAG: phosphate ABC transporter permease PstA [Campylobacteraceae bacterium]|jgi:phosphate transport system permease protein|nr:phosphate ABC transporter permease PstA [Campylobacteraceae bacterium]
MTYKIRRVIISRMVLTLCIISAVCGIAFLFWILFVLCYKGFAALDINIFLNNAAPAGIDGGGLKNALIGQAMLVFFASFAGIPIGILAGTFLSEYGQKSKIANFIRDISDIMMSSPSIVIGAFVYAILVHPVGHFSGWAGIAALVIIMIPIVLRVTDDMLTLVPQTLREAAAALGASRYKVIIGVVYRGAKIGILTGALLAVARVSGETAPLLFTSFNNNFFSMDLNAPVSSLTVTMFNYATSPYADWQSLGWAAAFLLSIFILGINIIGRLIIKKRR